MNDHIMKIYYSMKYSLFSAICLILLATNDVSGQIQLAFSFTPPTCYGYTDGTATVTATGGAAPYMYVWSNGQSEQTITDLGPGMYFVTVTDQNSKVASGCVKVTQPAPLAITFTTQNLDCKSVNGTLTANPVGGTQPYSYDWSTGATSQTIQVSSAGTYYVTVTDANYCTKVGAYNVAPPAEFMPQYAHIMPLCQGQSNGSLSVSFLGTNPPFTWIWNNGVQNQGLTNIPAGTYSLTATDSKGCKFADTVTLMDPPKLIVEVFATNSKCNNLPNTGTVHAAVAGGFSPYTFAWNNGSNQQSQQGLPPGDYSVIVYDKNGCTATDTATITVPPALAGEIVALSPACGTNNGCVTVKGVGGTPPYTYEWPTLDVIGPTACGLAPGTYSVLIFDANSCQHEMSVTMTSINGLNVTLILTKAECPGVNNGTATAIVNPPTGTYNYQWMPQPNPNIPQINSLPAGATVSVTVTDVNTGCVAMATGAIGSHNTINVSVTDTDVTCLGDKTGSAVAIASGGTNPYEYFWVTPDTIIGNTISGLDVGAYPVFVTDAKGCTAVGVANISAESAPMANYDISVLECLEDSIIVQIQDISTDPFDTIVAWNWTIIRGNDSIQTNQQNLPILKFAENETITVILTVTSSKGCTSTISAPFQIMSIPDFALSVDSIVVDCENDPVPITVTGPPGNQYTWSPLANLTFNPDAQNVIVDPDETTVYQLVVANGQCADTVEVQVIRVEPLNLTVQGDSIVTCDTLVTLTANANAAAGATLVWYNINNDSIGTGNSIIVQAGGQTTFTVVATDAYGCSDSKEVDVVGNSVDVDVSFDAALSDCENTPVSMSVTNLDATDILTYQWSSNPSLTIVPQGGSNVTVTGLAGTYLVTVKVKNQHNCERVFTTQLTLKPLISLENVISANLCKGLEVDFQNTSGITGTWNFGDSTTSVLPNPTHIYAQPGAYNVTFISTEDCVLPYDTTIIVLPQAAVQAAIGNNYEDCSAQALIQFTDLSTHFYDIASWNWSFSTNPPQTSTEQNPLITFTQEDTITVTLTVTDINGCTGTATAQVVVNVVNDSISSQQPLCPGDSVALNPDFNPNYTYTWISQPNDPNFDANSPNPTVSPDVTTIYVATIVNGFCSLTDSVTVIPQPAATVDLLADTLVCSDDPVTIKTSGNGVTFVWSNNPDFNPVYPVTADSLTITPEKNGIYYVKATNAAGCSAIDVIQINNAEVNINGQPANPFICKGQSVALQVVNQDPDDVLTYEWTPALPPIQNPIVNPDVTTTYTVKSTNQFGCSDTLQLTVNVISIDVTAEVTGKDTICPGQSTELLATVTTNGTSVTYEWTPSGSLTGANSPNPNAAPTETTIYTVIATADDLCPDTANVTVFFMSTECREPYIFVPKAFTPNNDGNNDFFIVRGADITDVLFIVWDRWGEKVYETTSPQAQGWDGTFNGKELTPDSYAWYLRVICGNGETYVNKGDVTLLK